MQIHTHAQTHTSNSLMRMLNNAVCWAAFACMCTCAPLDPNFACMCKKNHPLHAATFQRNQISQNHPLSTSMILTIIRYTNTRNKKIHAHQKSKSIKPIHDK